MNSTILTTFLNLESGRIFPRISLFIFILTACAFLPALALDPQKAITQYGQNVWTQQNGLPTSAVNTILQDNDGYIWLGTASGLLRFDGDRFDLIGTDPEDNNNRETIITLYESKDTGLWIGTANDWVYRFKDGKKYRHGEPEGILSRNINTFFESRKGQIWIGTSYGLYKFADGKFTSVPIDLMYICGISEDTEGRIWVGTHDGIRIYEDNKKPWKLNTKDKMVNQSITTLFSDHEGAMWIGTYGGLTRWKGNSVRTFTTADGLSDLYITTICEDRNGNIWVGTNNGGVNRYAGGRWTSLTAAKGLSHNTVLSVTEDREGSIWIGTLDGLNRLKDVDITPYGMYEGIGGDYISGVAEISDRSMFFLSDKNSSVTCLKDGKISIISTPVGPAYFARDGSLWIGQTGTLINIRKGKTIRYDTSNGLPSKWITALGEDSLGLILSFDGVGIRRFVNGKLRPFLIDGRQYESTEFVACFYLQSNGTFWIGTSRGLLRIKDGRDTVFFPKDGVADLWSNSITGDKQGNLWISSPLGGLTRYRDGKFRSYTTKCGLFTNEINCVVCDEKEDIWLSSPRGIGFIRRSDLDRYDAGEIDRINTKVYTTADGMRTDECFGNWQPAGWKSHDGRIWFATKKGAVTIDPLKSIKNGLPPPVLIKSVVADQQVVPADTFISFAPGTQKFEFHYSGLSFLVPGRVLFKFKLDGYDQQYVEAGTRRVAYYTNLSPGDYRFNVIACNNDGVWNTTGASFTFKLEPRFYQTYWFYGLVLVILGLFVYIIVRWRIDRHIRREKELQVRIQEALANIKTLSGLVPICANCKKIRDDKGYWDQLEEYIQDRSEVKFSHGICPDCAKKLYPKWFEAANNKNK